MNNFYPFVNTPLLYAYDALEPYIDEKTMHLHHDRHLQTYIDNLNKLLEKNSSLQHFSLEELLTRWCRLPQHLQTPVRNNAGGVFNHRFYFNSMTPLLTIDVWEHAYYLKHYNVRAAYIDDWFRVINWQAVEERFLISKDC